MGRAYHATIVALHRSSMVTETPRPQGVRPHIVGGRIVVVALACWCVGWTLGLVSLLASGVLANGLSLVARVLLWASFGFVVVALLVRLSAALRNDSGE